MTIIELIVNAQTLIANGVPETTPVIMGAPDHVNLHPIKTIYKDDAPFANLESVLLIPDLATPITRPPLL